MYIIAKTNYLTKLVTIEEISELKAIAYILILSKKKQAIYDIVQLLQNGEEQFYNKGHF